MRDIGYKSTAFAMAELIDNAIQAAATKIDVVFGFDGGAKPTQIAVIDDGHGMEPTMVRASLVWGAGTRAENRSGFGKYGYGLPSASVSQCHRVEVYSKTEEGSWHHAYLDIDEIKDGDWTENGGRIEMPKEKVGDPPAFVIDFLKKHKRWDSFSQGSVVVWGGDLDRIDYKQREALKSNLLTHLGLIYRNYLVATPMTVDGEPVQPCDPLFLTPGFRYFDLDADRAAALPSATVEVKDKKTGEVLGLMRVRYSLMPPTFFRKPEAKNTNKPGRGQTNERLEIADANNGVIFTRNGRQIEVVRPPRSFSNINATTDRFWAIEVDFDATLDEMFAITTSKQQVRPDERVWDMLKDTAKMFEAIGTMRSMYKKAAGQVASQIEADKRTHRASVEAVEAAEKFRTTPRPQRTPARTQEATDNLKQAATRRAGQSGLEPAAVERELEAARQGKDRTVETEDLPGAPFFRVVQEGGTRILYLNVAHPFFTDLYDGPGSTPHLRASLEVLLWTVGDPECDAQPGSDRRIFYETERSTVWSPSFARALQSLSTIDLGTVESDDAA